MNNLIRDVIIGQVTGVVRVGTVAISFDNCSYNVIENCRIPAMRTALAFKAANYNQIRSLQVGFSTTVFTDTPELHDEVWVGSNYNMIDVFVDDCVDVGTFSDYSVANVMAGIHLYGSKMVDNQYHYNYDLMQFDLSDEDPVYRWETKPFDAGDFTGGTDITWTVASGDVTTLAFKKDLQGTLTVAFKIEDTTVAKTGGGNDSLYIECPLPNASAAMAVTVPCYVIDNGTAGMGICTVDGTDTTLRIQKLDGISWSSSTNATSVMGEITFPYYYHDD
jgi:hypothetical protein